MSQPSLSKEQNQVVNSISDWYKQSTKQYITLGGYAGTGKTTILGSLNTILNSKKKKLNIAYCSYTGKASRVLERKLRDSNSISYSDYIGTIHRLIYKAIVDERDNIIGWEKIPQSDFEYSLIVVDEASMITQDIWNDLLSFNVPIIAVGDHGQLPPIDGNFNLMDNPELRLEKIYRQEADNPIIMLSEMVRKGENIPFKEFGKNIKKLDKRDEDTQNQISDLFNAFDDSTMVLCGYNTTRNKLNMQIRGLQFDSLNPCNGDRVICLKNNRNMNIYNGMTGTILSIYKDKFKGSSYYQTEISLDFEEEPFIGKISIEQFNSPTFNNLRLNDINYFDFGYALTVHKAQGSQANRVILFEERFKSMDDQTYARWLYTAITRAEKELFIIG